MALRIHENEVEQICKRYEEGKKYELYKDTRLTFYEEQIKNKIQ